VDFRKDGGSYDKVYKCSKIVKHYYIYFHDQVLGAPCYLKLCTYFPFNAEFYFNGHNAVRLQLDAQGINYRMKDNSFTYVDDAAEGFRTVDLLGELSEFFQNSGQIRYELRKLQVRGLTEKVQGKQKYRVTELGVKILWINLSSNSYFRYPLITSAYANISPLDKSQPSKLEEAYRLLKSGLDLISKELHIQKAA